jgi:hypothetical protein
MLLALVETEASRRSFKVLGSLAYHRRPARRAGVFAVRFY